ncbi:hypothetical protein D3C78_1715680 [compost metagenome]
MKGLRRFILDPTGHTLGIRGVEEAGAGGGPDLDLAANHGLAGFLVDQLKAPGEWRG